MKTAVGGDAATTFDADVTGMAVANGTFGADWNDWNWFVENGVPCSMLCGEHGTNGSEGTL